MAEPTIHHHQYLGRLGCRHHHENDDKFHDPVLSCDCVMYRQVVVFHALFVTIPAKTGTFLNIFGPPANDSLY